MIVLYSSKEIDLRLNASVMLACFQRYKLSTPVIWMGKINESLMETISKRQSKT